MIDNYYLISLYGLFLATYIIILLFIYECNLSFCKFIKKYIISDLPFLQISDDNRFHTMDLNVNLSDSRKYRFSLFFIPLGQYKLYIFTIKNKKISLFKVLSYEGLISEELTSLKVKLYNDTETYNQKHKTKKIEILKDEISSFKETKNIASIKGTFYITILAAIVSILFTQIDSLKVLYNNISEYFYLQVIFLYVIILFINFILINIHFITVKPFFKEYYDDFISDEIDEKKFKYFYLNSKWYSFESRKSIGYIKNIEFYLIKNLIFSFIFICLYVILFN